LTTDLEQLREVLAANADATMPRFHPGMEVRDRVEALEDYLNLTAVARAELDRARLMISATYQRLSEQWTQIEGWQINLPDGRRAPTQADIREARRLCRPDLHDALAEARWLTDRLSEQIHRLELDDKAASRLYTIITGQ
jgi:phosphoglycerate-specific signal transduction histidine kinase